MRRAKIRRKIITRRDFLKVAAMAPFAGRFASSQSREKMVPEKKVRVVLIRDKDVFNSSRHPNPEIIQGMLDEAVATLMGEKDARQAWKKLVTPRETVGIKTNVWHYLPTGKEIERALKRRIMDAGVREERIGIDDRGVLGNPVFREASVLINARPARTHHWSGMGGCIKNFITFVPSPSDYHDDSCADLASIWYLPHVKGKTRLNVLVMLRPLFHGIGPHHYSEQYVWEYKGILLSQDPVAVDATGVRILQAKRRQYFGQERPLQPLAKHIFIADTKHRLGVSDPSQIELIKLGWQEDILI